MVIWKVSLKLLWFITLFCIVSWVDVLHFSENPIISNDTAIKIAYWLNSEPKPEDIYYSYDYVLIFLTWYLQLFCIS